MRNPPQEPDVVPGRRLSVVLGLIVAVTVGGVLVAYGIGELTTRGGDARWMSGSPPPIEGDIHGMETRVFVVEEQGIELHRRAVEHLGTYGWVDRARGIVHVPIGVAFELYLARQRTQQGERP